VIGLSDCSSHASIRQPVTILSASVEEESLTHPIELAIFSSLGTQHKQDDVLSPQDP
jgi:hypothetical protein